MLPSRLDNNSNTLAKDQSLNNLARNFTISWNFAKSLRSKSVTAAEVLVMRNVAGVMEIKSSDMHYLNVVGTHKICCNCKKEQENLDK
ncbi:hypothetical protein TNIN_57421 [Trichonephila inaurata madagascariensis]|uniref:Uncharacterized protein n=1 Tax=Trichonephila inaurata madagascariensis TaxID=2747483 RepID=A0A8X6XT22_9ARAC|nr:hypothetical protein TNIN_57421 [Trichonephila inaurata madagascariensis]